ncbi:hypothetical protein D3C84_317580 [compost metagenome]
MAAQASGQDQVRTHQPQRPPVARQLASQPGRRGRPGDKPLAGPVKPALSDPRVPTQGERCFIKQAGGQIVDHGHCRIGQGQQEVVHRADLGWQQGAPQQAPDGVTPAAAPEQFEALLGLATEGAPADQIQIDEVRGRTQPEVRIADVATPDHRLVAIHQQQLVVHAVVDAAKAEQAFQQQGQRAPAPEPEGVEQPHLDAGLCRHHLQESVVAGIEIVDEQLDPDPAPRRMEQFGQQQLAAAVLLPAVILGLDPAAGAADQLAAGLEGGAGIVEQGKFGGDQGSSPCHETVA